MGVSVGWPTDRHRLVSLSLARGGRLLAVVEPSADVRGKWCAFVVGAPLRRCATKLEAMRWAERQVLT